MAENDRSTVNGVTKEETATGFVYSFPLAEITTNTTGELITIFRTNNPTSTKTVGFEAIPDQLGASDAEGYVDAMANLAFYFNAIPGIPTIENATTDELGTDKILKPDGTGLVEWVDFVALIGSSTIVLEASSFIDQQPSGTDTPLQISFGAAQDNATIDLNADGTITFLKDGLYNIVLDAEYGRTGASGDSELRFRALVNNSPQSPVVSARIDSANTRVPLFFTLLTNFVVNDTFKIQILRDSSGNDSGGLFTAASTPGDWEDSPSARISIDTIT